MPRPLRPVVVHFLRGRENPLPQCGDWREEPGWTSARELVTCPFCLARLRDPAPPPPGGAIAGE